MKFNSLEKIDCPICKSKNFKIIKKSSIRSNTNHKKNYDLFNSSSSHKLTQQLVKCKKCELIYVSPRLLNEIINKGESYNKDEKFILQNQERIQTFKINSVRSMAKKFILISKYLLVDLKSENLNFWFPLTKPLHETK